MSLDLETGYVIDAEYTRHVFPDMFPRHLAYICAILGIETRAAKLSDGFDYCELGCGTGMTSNVMAASNPEGRFFAVDLNPAHIATATRTAAAGGLTNISFIESTFADLHSRNLPDFDIIALHGVYSWIGPEHRRQVVDFIRQKLRPGGVVYISYNTLPGWAATMPLRKLMVEHTANMPVNSLQKAKAALQFLKSFSELGGAYFSENPRLVGFIEEMGKHPLNYIVHEYLNADWHPQYFADVQRELAHARIAFAGDADTRSNYADLILSKAVRDVLDRAPNPVSYQTQRDFMVNTKFRRDVFVKGGSTLAAHKRERLFSDLHFGALRDQPISEKYQFPAGEVRLPPLANEILAKARSQPLSLAALCELGAAHNLAPKDTLGCIQLMVACEVLAPMRCATYGGTLLDPAARNPHISIPAFNAAVLDEAISDAQVAFFAGPSAGSMISLGPAECLLLAGYLKVGHAEAAAWGFTQLERRGMNLTENGITLAGRDAHLPVLQKKLDVLIKTAIPVLLRMGALTSAPHSG